MAFAKPHLQQKPWTSQQLTEAEFLSLLPLMTMKIKLYALLTTETIKITIRKQQLFNARGSQTKNDFDTF